MDPLFGESDHYHHNHNEMHYFYFFFFEEQKLGVQLIDADIQYGVAH